MKDPGTEPSLRRWYLSEQRQTLGYPPPEREHQGFNASGNQLLSRRQRSSLFRHHGQDESSDSESSADSDDDGAEYSDDAGGDDEEDEEMSAQDLPGDDGGSRVQGKYRIGWILIPRGRRGAAKSGGCFGEFRSGLRTGRPWTNLSHPFYVFRRRFRVGCGKSQLGFRCASARSR